MHCPSCGAQGAAEKKFCGDCGAPLPWICGACGGKNPADKRFCGDCGTVAHGPPRLPGPQAIAVAERRHFDGHVCGSRRSNSARFSTRSGGHAGGDRLIS
jgi:ribosomal protein L40E